jgi:hypothetical protein
MDAPDLEGLDDVDLDRHLEIENTFEEVLVLVDDARHDDRIPGVGPDHADDLVAVLVSSEFKNELERPFYGFGDPLWEDAQDLCVPVVEFPALEQAFSPLRRRDAEHLFDSLADSALAGRELEIGENILEKVESVDPPPVVSPELLMRLAERRTTGRLSREDLPGA